ncbi:hypothetical protein C8J56DRAFT_979259 [Mycena floridula]|nr:hypothetical protein C8J56DRAFT_979259 [Mycena floridula]
MPFRFTELHQATPLSKSLTHMSISEWSVSGLSRLVMPSLTSVHILSAEMAQYSAYIRLQAFAPFIIQSACSLHTLRLDQVLLNDDIFLKILHSVPHLQVFNFTPFTAWHSPPKSHISSQTYRRMSLDEPVPLVADLKSLTISIHPHVMDEILDIIMSRKSVLTFCDVRLVSPISSEKIPSEAIASFDEKVEQIRAKGMRLFARVESESDE